VRERQRDLYVPVGLSFNLSSTLASADYSIERLTAAAGLNHWTGRLGQKITVGTLAFSRDEGMKLDMTWLLLDITASPRENARLARLQRTKSAPRHLLRL